jgi:acetyltransferase-like isoleucine patch superfamily enzyme
MMRTVTRLPEKTKRAMLAPWIRLLQLLALYAPGATSTRIFLHRARGVSIGKGCSIGTAVILETSHPQLIHIGSNVTIGIRATVIAHFRDLAQRRPSVLIEDDVFIGPGTIILPNVTIGLGAVVTAGSVVTRSVAPMTMVQGNPATMIARCGVPLTRGYSAREFYRLLRPVSHRGHSDA